MANSVDPDQLANITQTHLFKYIENFNTQNRKFSDKNSDIFYIYALHIDCGYSVESPRRGGSNEYLESIFLNRNTRNNVYPCKPQFYYIKVGFKGVKIIKACFHDILWRLVVDVYSCLHLPYLP